MAKQIKFPKKLHETDNIDDYQVSDVIKLWDDFKTLGLKMSDWFTNFIGSWTFIFIQLFIFSIWMILNIIVIINNWDPYPFSLLNLFLGLEGAFTGPLIMMSQAKQEKKDRLKIENAYKVSQNTEKRTKQIIIHLETQNDALELIMEHLAKEHPLQNKE